MRWRTAAALLLIGTTAWAGDKDDVVAAGKKVAEAKNYAWEGSLKFEGDMPFGQGQEEIPESKFRGAHDADAGTHIQTEGAEYLKVGDKTITRPWGRWRIVEREEGGDGRPRFRGMWRMFGAFAGTPKTPGEELAKVEDMISNASKADATENVGDAECSVYSCDLTEDAAKQAAPFGRWIERMGGAEVGGTLKVWVDGDGKIVKVAASFQGNDFEISTIRAVTLADFGKAKVEIPADAKAALEGKKSDDF